MKFNLYVNCDNAAFDSNPAPEVVRILREVAQQIEDAGEVPDMFKTIRDVNGNDVGRYALKPDDYR